MSRYDLIVLTLLAAGCSQKEAPPAQAQCPPAAVAPASPPAACLSDTQCGERQLCVLGHCTDLSPALVDCGMIRVHFPVNSAAIPPEDMPRLDRVARCLRADLASHVTVEGNADERGSKEHNQELGEQRATTVAQYLTSKGVPAGKVKTVSFGEENPLCARDDQECYARNRRAAVRPASKDVDGHLAARKGK